MQRQLPLLLTAAALAQAEVFTKPSYEVFDCRGSACGGRLVCPDRYSLRCDEQTCNSCSAFGAHYETRAIWYGECPRWRGDLSSCCTCVAAEPPPPTALPSEVNETCQRDCGRECCDRMGSERCSSCNSELACPAGYALTEPRWVCRSSCSYAFGGHYAESRVIHDSWFCAGVHQNFDYRACRTCEGTGAGAVWVPVTGSGASRVCRGDNRTDDSPSYYTLSYAADLAACKARCEAADVCHGIEFGHGRCEVWTRAIEASAYRPGFECLRFTPSTATTTTTVTPSAATTTATDSGGLWEPVTGSGASRACRGDNRTDDSPSYYTLSHAADLAACKARCEAADVCHGIEFGRGRCEVWTRAIEASAYRPGFECLRFTPSTATTTTTVTPSAATTTATDSGGLWEPVTGSGASRACRGDNRTDDSPSYYTLSHATDLVQCKARCEAADVCHGIEFGRGRCEVWTRAIEASAYRPGFECLRFTPSMATNATTFAPSTATTTATGRGTEQQLGAGNGAGVDQGPTILP